MKDKSVLVIDTPESCEECRLKYFDSGDDAYFGGGTERCVIDGSEISISGRYDDCPLRPLPQKIDLEKQDEIDFETSIDEPYLADKIIESQGYKRTGATSDIYISWNACLKEITGDCDEE